MGSAEAISSEEHFILQVARPRKKSPPRADSEKIFPLRGLQIAKKSCPIKSSTEKFIHGVLKILLHAPRSTFHGQWSMKPASSGSLFPSDGTEIA